MVVRVLCLTAAVVISTLFGVSPSQANTEIEGQGPGGAYYKIVMPDSWNRTLVIWNHGFSLGDIEPVSEKVSRFFR